MNNHPRIHTRCPSCHNDTLTINNGHLLCTWHECKDPTLIDRISEVDWLGDLLSSGIPKLPSFRERFKGRVDGSDGTAVLDEQAYKEIQANALVCAINTCDGQLSDSHDHEDGLINNGIQLCQSAITEELKKLWPTK